ncbi:uncharacterized protein LOC135132990 [Zophobas morio]|uniref:uncharacterized protein LOC135132990 n=1 Tax=Zophobas morio TaxID=2755281 RepID=UPI0030827D99
MDLKSGFVVLEEDGTISVLDLVLIVNGFKSNSYITDAGVPQGSTLGPLLFTLFINDVLDCIRYSKVLIFADDIKIYREIRGISDSLLLKKDINNLVSWSLLNFLPLNENKSFIISFTHKLNVCEFDYKINHHSLQKCSSILDLGFLSSTQDETEPMRNLNVFTAVLDKSLQCRQIKPHMVRALKTV